MEKEIKAIWDDLHGELRKFIRARVDNPENSEDILQEVFLKIQLNLSGLKDSSKLTSWVYQITRNAITDHYRRQKHTTQSDIPDLAEEEDGEPLYAGLSRCINQKIAGLPENYKQAILLTSFKDYSIAEASRELAITGTATKSHLYRARQQLKKLLLSCRNIAFGKNSKINGHDFTEKN